MPFISSLQTELQIQTLSLTDQDIRTASYFLLVKPRGCNQQKYADTTELAVYDIYRILYSPQEIEGSLLS